MATTKEKTLALVAASGWVLDPSVTWSKQGYIQARDPEQEQNPYAFMKPGPDGGTWHIYLNYVRNRDGWSSYRSIGDTLREVGFAFTPTEGDKKIDLGVLKNTDNAVHGTYKIKPIWEALRAYKPNGNSESLTEVAAKLIKDPDTAIWLAFQGLHDDQVRRAKERAEAIADQRARKQPLPVVIPEGGPSWWTLTYKLGEAATALRKADGKSDLPQLVTDALLALENIRNVLTDEAEEIVSANLYEVHSGLAAFHERQG